MPDPADDVTRLLAEADDLPDGLGKVAILEQARDLADSHQDVTLGYEARKRLLPACLDAGLPDLMLVAYSWCLGQVDRDPARFDIDDILWQYRWVVSETPTFPQITLTQIHAALGDITARYRAAGSTLRPIHLLRMNVGISVSDSALCRAAYADWQAAAKDHLSDSGETERAFVADMHFFLEEYEEGIKACGPVLRGKMQSEHFFGSDCADLLYPLWKLGRLEDAANCHRRGYRYVAHNPRYVDCCGDHVAYLALTDQWPRASRLVEKHLPAALVTPKPNDRMAFLKAVFTFADRWRRTGRTAVALNLPPEVPVPRSTDGEVPLAELAAWAWAEAGEVAAAYDARNGNDYCARQLAKAATDAAG